jgi:prepilin-type processing-associated H-X9-DG protein/prepilin-type N-terminal cleavage/methylation domain-containing protein
MSASQPRAASASVAPSHPAFTLVELLVVIGIIALLIAILLPALGRAREAANTITCASNMRQVGQAVMLFTHNNDGRFPGRAHRTATGTYYSWHDILNHKVYGTNVLRDGAGGPIQRYMVGSTSVGEPGAHTRGPFRPLVCPSMMRMARTDYGRPWIMSEKAAGGPNWATAGFAPEADPPKPGTYGAMATSGHFTRYYTLGARVTFYRNPSEKILIIEASRGHDEFDPSQNPGLATPEVPWSPSVGAWGFPHPDLRMNILFVDGHVETMSTTELGSEFNAGNFNARRISFNGEGRNDPR